MKEYEVTGILKVSITLKTLSLGKMHQELKPIMLPATIPLLEI
jgi:hypothetical protein